MRLMNNQVRIRFTDIFCHVLSHCIYVKLFHKSGVFDQTYFSVAILHLLSMVNKGMVVSTGKFGMLIDLDAHQEGEIKQINREQLID